MNKQLPERPDLEQLKKQAKELLDNVHAGQAEALVRIGQENREDFALNDAQRILAREYGFESWPKLKLHVETRVTDEVRKKFHEAFAADDAVQVGAMLRQFSIAGPILSKLVSGVRSPAMLDALLAAGADIDAKSEWWAGGFGVLHQAAPEIARYAITRGAAVDIHAAARLGLVERVKELLVADPMLVGARGGDGQTPLHFAATVEIAECLLAHGADLDALDVDHESTPAQYMVRDRQEIARLLVAGGGRTDLLMLAALGDQERICTRLDREPDEIRLRVSDEFFPMVGGKSGGTIYQWTLGWYVSPLDVARQFGHHEVHRLLWARSPADVRLIYACWQGDLPLAKAAAKAGGIAAGNLAQADRRHLAHAARNNALSAVETMLAMDFPNDGTSQHGATALHWAAFHGNAAMTKLLLRYQPALEAVDAAYNGTPLGWAIHGSREGWFRQKGDYALTARLLLEAGASNVERVAGSAPVQAVLRRFGAKDA